MVGYDLQPGAPRTVDWPEAGERSIEPSSAVGLGVAAAAVAVPTAVHLLPAGLVVAVAGALVGAATATARSRWWAAMASGALLAGLVWSGIDATTATVLTLNAAAWHLVRGRVDHDDRDAVRATLTPLGVGAAALVLGDGWLLPGMLAAAAMLLLALRGARPAAFGVLGGAVARVGAVLAAVLRTLAMLPAAVVVTIAWAWNSLWRTDPLGASAGWHQHDEDEDPARLYVRRSTGARAPRPRARRLVAFGLVALAAIVGVWAVWYRDPPGPPTGRAVDGQPDFAQVWREQQGFSRNVQFDPVTVYRFGDFRSEHVNQVDGVRTTWQPPPCDCPMIDMWWFGGSAAWGFFQSDDRTIPSQLARAAWQQGVALRIRNYAAPGYTLGTSARQFASLSTTEPAPDLAVFYDGANELDFQIRRNDAGRGTDESAVAFYDPQLEQVVDLFSALVRVAPTEAEGAPASTTGPDPVLDAPELAGHALARYRRDVDLVQRVAGSIGTVPVFVWQPTQTTASSMADAPFEPVTPWRPADLEWFGRLVAAARSGLPDGVIDLSDLFATSDEPIFPDWPHTNERGAELVAEELWPLLLEAAGTAAGDAAAASDPGG